VAASDAGLVVHVLSGPEAVPRLAGVAWALADTGVLAQVVFDAGSSGAALAELAVPAAVRELGVAAESDGRRLGGLLEAVHVELATVAPAAVVVHGDDDAALAGALAAARQGVPLARVGRTAGADRFARVIERLADLLLVHDEHDVGALVARGIPRGRIRVAGDPLADALRRAGQDVAARGAARRAGVRPGRYVLVTIDDPASPPALADALSVLAARVPLILQLAPELAAAWDAAAALAPLAESAAAPAAACGFAERVSLVRSAAAVITDSALVRETAALLGVRCHEPSPAVAGLRLRGAHRPLRVAPTRDGRAGARVAEAVLANFVRLRLS
jgi:UDP-N-acetylglucosamine 2-epimerase (non-hydrolysing)